MTDTELKSCIGTIEMLRRLHGVMNVIDSDNCEKIIKVLSDIPKYKDAYNKGWDDGAKASYEHLKMCEEEQGDDLISRDAVIDIIHRFFTEEVDKIPTKKTEDGEVLVIHKCQPLFEMNKAICKRIKALPSVSPTQNCVGNALDMRCDDAISRDELLKAIDTWDKFGYTETGCFVREPKGDYVPYIHYDDVIKCIKGMPSVNLQEKTGHWIPVSERLPEKYTYTLWCASSGYVRSDYFNGEFWEDAKKYCYEVIAWMPLPPCYGSQTESEE